MKFGCWLLAESKVSRLASYVIKIMKKSSKLLRILPHILPLLVIAAVTIYISAQYLNEPPGYIHAWTQADNYSLALGFRHNGGDFFHPQTMIYNKQQYGFDDPESLVTGCDLPLHHYLVAVLMGITNSTEPWVFRGFTLAVAILGLWALYLLAFVLTRSRAKSLLVATLTATAPAYAYYRASFLPTVPALSLAMGGLLLYVLHLRDGKTWTLYVSLLLLTLSMMERTSFAVLWIAVAGFQFLRILRKETTFRISWLPFFAGAVLFAGWWFWNMHLRNEYGSLFLASLLPVTTWDNARCVFEGMRDHWRFHYFQRLQYWLYVGTAAAMVVTLIVKRKTKPTDRKPLSLWWLLAIWMFGELLFTVAMFEQFMYHDYYFLDSLFLPIVMLLVGMLAMLPDIEKQWGRVVSLLVVLALTGFMTAKACYMQVERRKEGVEAFETAMRYKHAYRMVDKAGFKSREIKYMTLFSYPQNTPFVMMNMEGYSVMWTDPEVVNHALTFDYDYILVEDEVYRREFEGSKYILSRLKRIAGDGEISLCELSDTVIHATADHFFQ